MMAMISAHRHPAGRDLADASAGGPAARHLSSRPSRSASTTPGVGPLGDRGAASTRPLEQALSAVPGLEQIELDLVRRATRNVRLNFAWGTDLNEADERHARRASIACAAGCRRTPDPPTIFKFDSNAAPIMGLGVEGDYDRVTLRELAENDARRRGSSASPASRPSRSTAACAGRFTSSCRRRRSRRSICRSIASSTSLRTENQNIPLGESLPRATRPTCSAARASSRTSTRFATSSC